MRITFLCSDERHPINAYLQQWMQLNESEHQIELLRTKNALQGGDILFLISCSEIVGSVERSLYRASLVLHASDLPVGRGWSPHIWQILGGAEDITLSLLEAESKVDSGRIWQKINFSVPKHALWDEINARLFAAELELIDFAVREFERITPKDQDDTIEPTYYDRRNPVDSRIDPHKSIAEQFDHIRICDPERFPAFFEFHGHKYKIILEKLSD